MPEYFVRSAGWNVLVTASSAGEAIDFAVDTIDESGRSREALGTIMQVVNLDAADEATTYVTTERVLARLGFKDIETPSGLIVNADSIQ